MTLYDELMAPLPPPAQIILQRSELETYITCPLCYRLGQEHGDEDADAHRPRDVGIEFHRVMDDYLTELIARGERRDPDALCSLALAADARYQPDLLHLAKLTGPRIQLWLPQYIAHEEQYGYALDGAGPHGETVVLTIKPDLVLHGDGPGELRCPDWKTGWGKGGHDWQAMFNAVVLSHSLEHATALTWQPFYCRYGTWGKAMVYEGDDLRDAERIVLAGVTQFLGEGDWNPSPGTERCRYCAYTEHCDADRRFAEIDDSPQDFALATQMAAKALKDRMDAMKAWVKANGPLQVDGEWFGSDPIKKKVTYAWNKGTPGFLGEEDGEDDDAN